LKKFFVPPFRITSAPSVGVVVVALVDAVGQRVREERVTPRRAKATYARMDQARIELEAALEVLAQELAGKPDWRRALRVGTFEFSSRGSSTHDGGVIQAMGCLGAVILVIALVLPTLALILGVLWGLFAVLMLAVAVLAGFAGLVAALIDGLFHIGPFGMRVSTERYQLPEGAGLVAAYDGLEMVVVLPGRAIHAEAERAPVRVARAVAREALRQRRSMEKEEAARERAAAARELTDRKTAAAAQAVADMEAQRRGT
jgi:hypothetical protein